jgi:phosphoglycolate phosphatase-like HAD superfamily hydrolase
MKKNLLSGELGARLAIMIGDRVEDIQAASAAGISSIGMALGYDTEHDLLGRGEKFVFPN